MRKLDLYGECNVGQAPVELFTSECCAHCLNAECTRSQAGNSRFDVRTATWYDRLFAQVPRMDRGDPRYGQIAAQQFAIIQPSVKLSSSWDAPVADPVTPSLPLPVVLSSEQQPAASTSPAAASAPVPLERLNTTGGAPRMLESSTPVEAARLVRPGARIKI